MTSRPSEEDQIRMIVKNLQPAYFKHLFSIPISTFDQLCKAGIQIEDAILDGKIEKEDNRTWKRVGNSGIGNNGVSNGGNKGTQVSSQINAVNTNNRPFPVRQSPRTYTDIGMSLSAALKNLTKSGKLKPLEPRSMPDPIPPGWNMNEYCHFHQRAGHNTDRCGRLRNEIQDLLEGQQKPNITQNPLPNHQEKPNYQNMPPPLFLNLISLDEPMIAPITIDNPMSIFEAGADSEDDKESWNWGKNGGSIVEADYWYEDSEDEEVLNLTRSGRHYTPPHLAVDHPGREIEGDKKKDFEKKMEEEDDTVLRQLKKSRADISIWGLLVASYGHRKALLESLSKQNVTIETTPQELVSMVDVTLKTQEITFSDEDLPSDGVDHVRALHLLAECCGRTIPMVLVDNGSALNVCPLRTANILGLDAKTFSPSNQSVRAYDNTKRTVVGVVTLECQLGPLKEEIEFHVLDVPASFNLLLGRPWLHKHKAVPSTAHQKVKLKKDDGVLTICGDDLYGIAHVFGLQQEEEVPLHGFELASVNAIEQFPEGHDTYINPVVAPIMNGMQFFPSLGLGR